MYHELIHCVLFGITCLQYNSLHRIWAHEFCWIFFSLFWVKLGRVNSASEGRTVQRPLSEVNNNLTAWHMSVQLLTSSGKLYSTPSIVQYISGFVSFKNYVSRVTLQQFTTSTFLWHPLFYHCFFLTTKLYLISSFYVTADNIYLLKQEQFKYGTLCANHPVFLLFVGLFELLWANNKGCFRWWGTMQQSKRFCTLKCSGSPYLLLVLRK